MSRIGVDDTLPLLCMIESTQHVRSHIVSCLHLLLDHDVAVIIIQCSFSCKAKVC